MLQKSLFSINHLHFSILESTQLYLLENKSKIMTWPKENKEKIILVSCDHQTKGIGQYHHQWENYNESFAFSIGMFFSKELLSKASLILGIALVRAIKHISPIPIFLKWPNDLMSPLTANGQTTWCKVGGILVNLNQDYLIFGIGLNILPKNSNLLAKTNIVQKMGHDQFSRGFLTLYSEYSHDEQTIQKKIYHFAHILLRELNNLSIILQSDLSQLKTLWEKFCFHLHSPVIFKTEKETIAGTFSGINIQGGAIITTTEKDYLFYNGKLYVE